MCGGWGGWGVKALLRPANFTLGPDATINKTVKQKAKMAAVEGDQNSSITTQLVKQKAKWAAIEDGDHNASTTHTEKNTTTTTTTTQKTTTKKQSNLGTTKLQRVRTTPGRPP